MTPHDDDRCGPSCLWFLVLCTLAVAFACGLALTTGDIWLSVALAAAGVAMGVGIVLTRRGGR